MLATPKPIEKGSIPVGFAKSRDFNEDALSAYVGIAPNADEPKGDPPKFRPVVSAPNTGLEK